MRNTYTFRIKNHKPATFPMERLGEYLVQISKILGEPNSVHFDNVHEGSVAIEIQVDEIAEIRVRDRYKTLNKTDTPIDVKNASEALNKLLREDNTSATFSPTDTLVSAEIIEFPGVKAPIPQRIGPIKQPSELQGVIVSLRGKDKSKHVILEDQGESISNIEVNEGLALELREFMFDATIRLSGEGKWFREPDGNWTLASLKATSFSVLEDKPLGDLARELRSYDLGWSAEEDPIKQLKDIRG
ncbi:hypothetical protein [Kiloniella majae]|uniref:hypothetical protein n=1 Tax=Kiloniella majae TaxID=1938558 RepID=UPI000F79B646|nr:hypothetical protein [Kiloniella majae]